MAYLNNDFSNEMSYVDLNKRRRGEINRTEGEKLVNRMSRPKVKKIYVKRSEEGIYEKPKLYVWRQWQSPKLEQLLEDVGPYVGMDDGAGAIFTIDGDQITDPDDIQDLGTYFISEDESNRANLDERRTSDPELERGTGKDQARYTSLSAPEYYTSNSVRSTYPNLVVPPTPPPRPYTSDVKPSRYTQKYDELEEYNNYYDDAIQDTKRVSRPQKIDVSQMDYLDEMPNSSDFDNEDTIRKDREALEKHRQRMAQQTRRESTMIYNRRDQTNPDAYIIYVFLNGQGMECQYMNFQRKQLEKGMNYVLELIARRYSVNPAKLVDMDGKKIAEVTQLMSRGAYVLIAAGQSFRNTWYFLPDNAIDTSSNKAMVEERSAQRDRLLQRRQKKEQKMKEFEKKQIRSKSVAPVKQNINFKRRTEAASVPRNSTNLYR